MSDSEEEFLLLCYLRNSLIAQEIRMRLSMGEIGTKEISNRRRKRKRTSRIKLRPWVNEKIKECNRLFGPYGLAKELSLADDQIMRNLNMPAADFYELLDLIKDDIKKKGTLARDPIPAETRLSITLR